MKKLIIYASAVALSCIFAGCSGESDGWYAFQGGYVNLRNVKTITTHAQLTALKSGEDPLDGDGKEAINGVITRDSIEQAKSMIRKEYGKNLSKVIAQEAYIAFDGQKVELPSLTEFESYKDVLNLLDVWLGAVESLELPTK